MLLLQCQQLRCKLRVRRFYLRFLRFYLRRFLLRGLLRSQRRLRSCVQHRFRWVASVKTKQRSITQKQQEVK